MINTGASNPNTCSAFCGRFLIINGVLFAFLGIMFMVIGIAASGSVFPLIGGAFLFIGILNLIPGIILCVQQKRRMREAMEQQQTQGPVVVGYNPGQGAIQHGTHSAQQYHRAPTAPDSYQPVMHGYQPEPQGYQPAAQYNYYPAQHSDQPPSYNAATKG